MLFYVLIYIYVYIYIYMYTCHIISYTTTKQPPNQVALCPCPKIPGRLLSGVVLRGFLCPVHTVHGWEDG